MARLFKYDIDDILWWFFIQVSVDSLKEVKIVYFP